VKENTPPECILCIVGNKADLATDKARALGKRAMQFAKENRMLYFETSSQWTRNEVSKEQFYSKGIENIILELIENVSIQNPKKSLYQSDNMSFQEIDSMISHMKSIQEDTPISCRSSCGMEPGLKFNETMTKPNTPMNSSIVLNYNSITLEKKQGFSPPETNTNYCGC